MIANPNPNLVCTFSRQRFILPTLHTTLPAAYVHNNFVRYIFHVGAMGDYCLSIINIHKLLSHTLDIQVPPPLQSTPLSKTYAMRINACRRIHKHQISTVQSVGPAAAARCVRVEQFAMPTHYLLTPFCPHYCQAIHSGGPPCSMAFPRRTDLPGLYARPGRYLQALGCKR